MSAPIISGKHTMANLWKGSLLETEAESIKLRCAIQFCSPWGTEILECQSKRGCTYVPLFSPPGTLFSRSLFPRSLCHGRERRGGYFRKERGLAPDYPLSAMPKAHFRWWWWYESYFRTIFSKAIPAIVQLHILHSLIKKREIEKCRKYFTVGCWQWRVFKSQICEKHKIALKGFWSFWLSHWLEKKFSSFFHHFRDILTVLFVDLLAEIL